jgi:hypothetical protein
MLFLNLKNCNMKWLCHLKVKKTMNYSKPQAVVVTKCSEIVSGNEPKSITSVLLTMFLLPSSGIMM